MKYIKFTKNYLAYKQGSFMVCSEKLESRLIKSEVAESVTKKEYTEGLKELREVKNTVGEKDCEDCKDSNGPGCEGCGDNQAGILGNK